MQCNIQSIIMALLINQRCINLILLINDVLLYLQKFNTSTAFNFYLMFKFNRVMSHCVSFILFRLGMNYSSLSSVYEGRKNAKLLQVNAFISEVVFILAFALQGRYTELLIMEIYVHNILYTLKKNYLFIDFNI